MPARDQNTLVFLRKANNTIEAEQRQKTPLLPPTVAFSSHNLETEPPGYLLSISYTCIVDITYNVVQLWLRLLNDRDGYRRDARRRDCTSTERAGKFTTMIDYPLD